MAQGTFRIVGRMRGFWPGLVSRYEQHRLRKGGEVAHIDPTRTHLNRVLIGGEDWAATTLDRVETIRATNYDFKLASLQRRKRKADLLAAIAEGPADPWRPTEVGPMRELILTAHRDFFASMPPDLDGRSLQDRFETTAVRWLQENFGQSVIHARADLDEATYHIHAVIMPVAEKEGGRAMLEPSAHPFIKDYERLQDSLGDAFRELGLVRGERRAERTRQAVRKVRAGETVEIPKKRKHIPTRQWREEETVRLVQQAERQGEVAAEQAAAEAQLKAEAARLETQREEQRQRQKRQDDEAIETARETARVRGEAKHLAAQGEAQKQREAALAATEAALATQAWEHERRTAAVRDRAKAVETRATEVETRRLAVQDQAKAQDAFAAAAEAVALGLIAPDKPDMASISASTDAERSMLARMRRSRDGLERFFRTMSPVWAKMRHQARAAAEAEVAHERAEIADLWGKLKAVAVQLDPSGTSQSPRDAIDRAIARALALAGRGPKRKRPGEQDRD